MLGRGTTASAVRLGRKKSKCSTSSRQGSAASVSLSRDIQETLLRNRERNQEFFENYKLDKRLQYVIYTGTIVLAIGLFTLAVGVSSKESTIRNIGLVLIAIGTIICAFKVLIAERKETQQINKTKRIPIVVSPDSTTSNIDDTFEIVVNDKSNESLEKIDEKNEQEQLYQNNSITNI